MTDRAGLFDKWATSYDTTLVDSSGFPFEGYVSVLRRLFELASPRRDQRVLDLGTGTGALASLFVEAGCCSVTGVDFSEEMLAQARAKAPSATFLRTDLLQEWPDALRQRSFDLAVSSYVLHEFTDAKKVEMLVRIARESLARGGLILVGDILFADAEARTRARESWRDVWDDDEHYGAADALIAALESRGLAAKFEELSFCAGVLILNA